jgi:hypothetical protein
MAAADEGGERPASPRLHHRSDLRAAGDLLARAGFALPVADAEPLTLRYPGPCRNWSPTCALWGGPICSAPARGGRSGGSAMPRRRAPSLRADPDGKVPERLHIIHLSGWAPSPDQPQPARRGSATTSLAAALARRDAG